MMKRDQRTRKSGHSLLEACFGLIVIYGIGVVIVDLAMGIYAVSLNDSTCRNAASFAAAGDPKQADRRVSLIIDQSTNKFGELITAPTVVQPLDIKITSQPVNRRDPDTDKLINPGGLVTGTVTVKTQIEVRPFAVDMLLRQYKVLTFQSCHSSPIHYVMPPS
jgi:hypothetical protein